VIHTLINSGETFKYRVRLPANEPPGLYWYHPHVHGLTEAAVQGGASGAIVVEGIENLQPEVAGLPERVLLIRDQPIADATTQAENAPAWDISLNYVPIPYPSYPPAVIEMKPGQREVWRVANAAAGTIIDLQLQYDGVPQPFEVVALDGVPTGSRDGTKRGKAITQTDILLAPAARAEFIVTGPSERVKNAVLLTLGVDTGPDGDNDPGRPIARIATTASPPPLRLIPASSEGAHPPPFEGLATAPASAERTLLFFGGAGRPQRPGEPYEFLHHSRRRDPRSLRPE
jgi:FtsP/CotA-like multicopper oxidase with cupredoxin domain